MHRYIYPIAAVLLIAGIAYGLWECLSYFASLLTAASAEVAAAVIGGMFTAFVAIVAALFSHRFARVRASEDAHRTKKVEIYREFLNIVTRQFAGSNEQIDVEPLADGELTNFFIKFKSDIILWASPTVLNAFRDFTVHAGAESVGMFKAVDDLHRAMRKDIVLSNWGMEPYAFVKMYLSDPSELDELVAANKPFKRTQGKTRAA